MTEAASNILKRYTSFAVALDILAEKRLTLVSPSSWQDTNDTAFLEAYRSRRGVGAVFAACFTQSPEKYHHWQVFSGNAGVRVDIDKKALLSSLRGNQQYLWKNVEYLTLEKMEGLKTIDLYRLPFLKRFPFKDEVEFRILYESEEATCPFHYVPLECDWIKGVTLSPWLPANLIESARTALKSIPGCAYVHVGETTLIDNARWKRATERILDLGGVFGPPPQEV